MNVFLLFNLCNLFNLFVYFTSNFTFLIVVVSVYISAPLRWLNKWNDDLVITVYNLKDLKEILQILTLEKLEPASVLSVIDIKTCQSSFYSVLCLTSWFTETSGLQTKLRSCFKASFLLPDLNLHQPVLTSSDSFSLFFLSPLKSIKANSVSITQQCQNNNHLNFYFGVFISTQLSKCPSVSHHRKSNWAGK